MSYGVARQLIDGCYGRRLTACDRTSSIASELSIAHGLRPRCSPDTRPPSDRYGRASSVYAHSGIRMKRARRSGLAHGRTRMSEGALGEGRWTASRDSILSLVMSSVMVLMVTLLGDLPQSRPAPGLPVPMGQGLCDRLAGRGHDRIRDHAWRPSPHRSHHCAA